MTKKLAHIERVNSIKSIKEADSLELAEILGWQVVIKKGEFKEGDLVVFIEVDSLLPIDKRYEFLRKSCYKRLQDGSEWFRLKSAKLRGTLSQGILFSTDIYSELKSTKLEEGLDVTGILNIHRYEPPIPVHLSGEIEKKPNGGSLILIFKILRVIRI